MNLINNRNNGNQSLPALSFRPDNDEEKKAVEQQNAADDVDFGNWENGYGSFSKGISPQVEKDTMAEISGLKTRLGQYESIEKAKGQYGNMFKNTFRNNFDPDFSAKYSNRFRSTSPGVAKNSIDDELLNDMKMRLRDKRNKSKSSTRSAYMDGISIVGANPETTMFQSLSMDQPLSDIENTILETDAKDLVNRAEPLAKQNGMTTEDYINTRMLPDIYEKLLDEVVKEDIPKSSAEYMLRASLSNSLTGKTGMYGNDALVGNNEHTLLQDEAMRRYNPNRFEKLASGIGSLLVDIPMFSALGIGASAIVGKVSSFLTNRLATRIFATKFAEGMTQATANRLAANIITKRIGHKILQSSAVQGLTLGSYDAMNSVVDDLLIKNDINTGKTAESFGKGLLTGAVLGVVGTPLREAAKGTKGLKKLFAGSGVLSAESAVFTASTELEKMKHGIEITPIDVLNDFVDSSATLLVMRMTHWRPKGAEFKLNDNGQLKKEFQLSSSERAELNELNVNPEQLIAAIESELKLPSFGGEKARFIKETYASLMTNKNLSVSTKSKLMFLVENKITSTPPVEFDFSVKQNSNGKWEVMTYDAAGRVVSRNIFDHAGNAKSYFMVHRANIRRNRIILFETELTNGLRSTNFLRQAGLYAKKNKISIDDVASAIYKQSTGEQMSLQEKKIVEDILERASYDEAGMVQMLYNARRNIEKKCGLEKGTMLLAIKEDFYRLTDAQNKALDDYEKMVRGEVERLEQGTDRRRTVRMLKQGLNSDYFGMTNEEVKKREIEDYFDWVAIRDADRVGLRQESRPHAPLRPIYIPPEDNSGYVWSFGPSKNTKEDIAMYKERASSIAERFGVKLNFIFDEREIARPDINDQRAVMNYNNMITAEGWTTKGKVFINLPNAMDVESVEKTVFHEVVAHKGLMNVFGEHLYNFMEDIYKKASPEVLRGINKIKRKYYFADNYTVVEEYLAHLAESVSLTPQERSVYTKVKDYIKSLLIRLNIYTGSNRQISEKELVRIMQRHSEYMQKGTRPQEYIKEVFGDFSAAHRDAETYYSTPEFLKGIKAQAEQGKLFSTTPKFFRNSKELLYYDYLTPEQQKKVRDRYGITEEDMQQMTNQEQYRLLGEYDEENRLPYEEKTTFGERSGAVPGNSSSEGLILGGSAHLSHGPLAQPKPVANIDAKTLRTKYSLQKYLNKGKYDGRNRVQDVVRGLGNVLQFDKSRTSQSYYGDLSINGRNVRVRVSTHPASGDRIGNSPADDKISIVVYKNGEHSSRGEHAGYTEYIYDPREIPLNDAANSILNGVMNLIETGEYVDYTNKAEKHTYPYYQNGKVNYRMSEEYDELGERDEYFPYEEKTTFGERSGAVPSRYSLAAHEDVTNMEQDIANVKGGALKNFYDGEEPYADEYLDAEMQYRPQGETAPYPGDGVRYRIPDGGRSRKAKKELPPYGLEEELFGKHTELADAAPGAVPLLKDPFYRSLRANSPTYSYVYEHLRKLPLEEWTKHDHDLWDTLVGMAEGGAVQFVLKDIVTDPKFISTYPELAMLPVSISKDLPVPVMYDKEKNRIFLDRRVYLYPQSKFYIDGALQSVARDFEERRNSAARQVNEFNSRFKKKYNDAVTYARKIAMMRQIMPEFDAENKIAESYRSEYGFYPDEFLSRFPDMDDYLLHRVTRGMGTLIDRNQSPEFIMHHEKLLNKKINQHRKFFWGPVEIIIDAAANGEGEGPLRVAGEKDHKYQSLPSSGLDLSENIMYEKYLPSMLKRFNLPMPSQKRGPWGWEEYRDKKRAELKRILKESEESKRKKSNLKN